MCLLNVYVKLYFPPPLTPNTFKHIFENNQCHYEPPTIYNEYNISKEDLLDIIMSIKPSLQNSSIKNRLNRFTKTLNAEPYDSNESEA